jgi:hypothetical protein
MALEEGIIIGYMFRAVIYGVCLAIPHRVVANAQAAEMIVEVVAHLRHIGMGRGRHIAGRQGRRIAAAGQGFGQGTIRGRNEDFILHLSLIVGKLCIVLL